MSMSIRFEYEDDKFVNIPKADIEKLMVNLDIDEFEACELWCDDHDITVNEEQQALIEKTKNYKVNHDAQAKKPREKAKPRTVVVSDEKQTLFSDIWSHLSELYGENAEIVKKNKLIIVKIGDKHFKVDLIEQRKSKK